MISKIFLWLLTTIFLTTTPPAEAQDRVARIGYLTTLSLLAPDSDRKQEIRRALQALGYIEGQNISMEYRSAEGKLY